MIDTTKVTKTEEWTHPLFLAVTTDKDNHERLKRRAESFLFELNLCSKQLRKETASYNDCPENEIETESPKTRQAVAIELLEYFLTESEGL